MNIESGNRKRIAEPDSRGIAQLILALRDDPEDYVILARKAQEYVQTICKSNGRFIMEYRDGSADRHFHTKRDDLECDEVIRAFQAYARGDKDWNTPFEWRLMTAEELSMLRGCGRSAAMLLAAIVIILTLVVRAVWAN